MFGIGLSKTGTSSLTAILDILRFRPALHNPWCHAEIAQCRSATDLTIAWRFRTLRVLWPDARFIYTTRERRRWLASSERHFTTRYLRHIGSDYNAQEHSHSWALHEAMLMTFGTLEYSEEAWISAYDRHHESVLTAFADQPERLLVIDITDGGRVSQKWKAICEFLEVPRICGDFPHKNKTAW